VEIPVFFSSAASSSFVTGGLSPRVIIRSTFLHQTMPHEKAKEYELVGVTVRGMWVWRCHAGTANPVLVNEGLTYIQTSTFNVQRSALKALNNDFVIPARLNWYGCWAPVGMPNTFMCCRPRLVGLRSMQIKQRL